MTTDEIRLTVADIAEAATPARVAAAGLALRLGLAYQQVEDLRIAIDEAVHLASTLWEGALIITYGLSEDGITVTMRAAEPPAEPASGATVSQFAQMVEDLVTGHEVDPAGRISLRLERQVSTG